MWGKLFKNYNLIKMTALIYDEMISSTCPMNSAKLVSLIGTNLYFENTSDELLDCELNIFAITNITDDTRILLNRFIKTGIQPNEEINFNNFCTIPKTVNKYMISRDDHCFSIEVHVSSGSSEEKRLLMVKKDYIDVTELMCN